MVRLLITLPRVSVVLPRGRGGGARDDRVRARLRRWRRSRSRGKSLARLARTGFRARVATPSTPLDAARAATRRRAARRRRRGDAERAIRRRRRRARDVRDVPIARVF